MNNKLFFKTRLYITLLVTLFIWALLIWNHTHGGVPRHHILANEDLPSFSNWWGGLLLPLLTWFLLYRIEVRINRIKEGDAGISRELKKIGYGFAGALFFGIALSFFFTFGYTNITGYLIFVPLLLAFFFPIYRAECLLGFVIGMTFTFGAVLPTGIGLILLLMGVFLYLGLRAGIIYAVSKLAFNSSPDKKV